MTNSRPLAARKDLSNLQFPETVKAFEATQGFELTVGRMILKEIGPSFKIPGKHDESDGKIVALRDELIAVYGHCDQSTSMLRRWRSVAQSYGDLSYPGLSWSALEAAKTPEILDQVIAAHPEKWPLTREEVRNKRKTLDEKDKEERRWTKLAVARAAEEKATEALHKAPPEQYAEKMKERDRAILVVKKAERTLVKRLRINVPSVVKKATSLSDKIHDILEPVQEGWANLKSHDRQKIQVAFHRIADLAHLKFLDKHE